MNLDSKYASLITLTGNKTIITLSYSLPDQSFSYSLMLSDSVNRVGKQINVHIINSPPYFENDPVTGMEVSN